MSRVAAIDGLDRQLLIGKFFERRLLKSGRRVKSGSLDLGNLHFGSTRCVLSSSSGVSTAGVGSG